jgi:hypothetical protein
MSMSEKRHHWVIEHLPPVVSVLHKCFTRVRQAGFPTNGLNISNGQVTQALLTYQGSVVESVCRMALDVHDGASQ